MTVKAKEVKAAAVYASCGKCGEELISPDGSFLLDIATSGPHYPCPACRAINTLTKTAKVAS